jgi:hypothetical protein
LGMETVGSWATEWKEDELVPRLVEHSWGRTWSMSRQVICTAVRTEAGELFTFGDGSNG